MVKTRSELLDQYYTKRPIAKELYEITVSFLNENNIEFDCWLEPAAGDGAFFELLPPDSRLGIDIDARLDEIIEDNFFTIDIKEFRGLRYVAIGNPPFGKNATLAIRFFNRCADMCEVVAFIVPRTFKKPSVINRLHPCFHKMFEKELPDNSFEIEGIEKTVPCVFQIWVKRPDDRLRIRCHRCHPDLEFLPPDRLHEATILFQRVGGGAGTFKDPGEGSGYSWKSNYHIRCSTATARVLRTIVEWPSKYDTAGNPSISKSDLIEAYIEAKMPKVHNKHHNTAPLDAVYCGRGSIAGNLFVIGKDGDRDEVCNKFEQYIENNPDLKRQIIEYCRGRDLVCFCKPKRCHCDYILRIANE
jgi:predicted RNA methylase